MDGRYRFTETDIGTYAALGEWTRPDTFEISYQYIGYSNPGKWVLTFEGKGIKVIETGVTGEYRYSGIEK